MSSKEELLKRLSDGVVEMEEDDVEEAAKEYLEAGYPAFDGIMEGLVDGMNRASQLYEEEEYFVTDVLLCSDAMYVGLDILRPYLPEESGEGKIKGVIGVVEGDTHDIGKNLVKIMMETAGFEMIDLGRDVPVYRDGKRRRGGSDLHVYFNDDDDGRHGDGDPYAGRRRTARQGKGHDRRRPYFPEICGQDRRGRLFAECGGGRETSQTPA